MSILKLANPGDEATLEIAACNLVQGEYGEQVRFDTKDDVTLYLPKASADRQLERIGLLTVGEIGGYDGVIGQTLVFSRTPNSKPGSKPYWNINVAKPNGKPPIAKTSPPKSPPSFASKPEAELPEFLRDADAQDKAELAAKIGEVPAGLDKKASIAWAQKQSLAIVLEVYEPMFVAKNIGMTDDTVHKLSFELFKTWSDKGLVG